MGHPPKGAIQTDRAARLYCNSHPDAPTRMSGLFLSETWIINPDDLPIFTRYRKKGPNVYLNLGLAPVSTQCSSFRLLEARG